MSSKNHYAGLSPLLVRLVRHHAKRLKPYSCFASYELEDLEQELIIEAIRCLPQYDATRSQLKTFLNKILERKSFNLIRDATRNKRADIYLSLPLGLFEDNEHILHAALEQSPLSSSYPDLTDHEICDRSLDRQSVKSTLSPFDATLYEHFMVLTIGEISDLTGLSRSALYRSLNRIKRSCVKKGLMVDDSVSLRSATRKRKKGSLPST